MAEDDKTVLGCGVAGDDATEAVQWFVDNGVPLPPGEYRITRPIQLRGDAIVRTSVIAPGEVDG